MSTKPTIIFEDADLLVLDKPAGLTIHEGIKTADTLVDFVAQHLKTSPLISERWGLLHRLDKFTSGLVLVAKTEKAFAYIKNLFKTRGIEKEYLVLVRGTLTPKEGRIELPLARGISHRTTFEARSTGRKAVTEYKVIKTFDKLTYLSASPKTGRTHQIRVHFAALGHPVVGDNVYDKTNDENLGRYFLHAHRLSFTNWDGIKREFISPLPEPLTKFLDENR